MIMNHDRSPEPKPSRKATILIIGPTPPPFMGPSVATKMILDSQLQDTFHLVHLDTSDRRSVSNIGRADFVDIYHVPIHVLKLIGTLIRHSPRIVYMPICQSAQGYLRDTLFIAFSKVFGARVLIHLRGGYFRTLYEKTDILTRFAIRNSLQFVSRVIVLGESLRYIFEGLVPTDRITVVPNGIDLSFITQEDIESVNKSTTVKKRVLFLSNLIESKGFFDVIKAIPNIIKSHNNVEFLFAGEFYDKKEKQDEVMRYINDSDLGSHVKFLGVSMGNQKKELLLHSDIFVFPTYYQYEGQPWVILEAMAAGLPIITTDQGSIKEMIIDGENGFIVEKQNPEQIAEKTIFLLQHEMLRKQMGQKSRQRFLEYYTKDRFIRNLEMVIDEAVLTTK